MIDLLYDNALLALAYTEAYEHTRRPIFRDRACRAVDYALRELTDPQGGFCWRRWPPSLRIIPSRRPVCGIISAGAEPGKALRTASKRSRGSWSGWHE